MPNLFSMLVPAVRLVVFSVLCATTFTAAAQKANLSWSEDISSETQILKILGRSENGHYALANRKKDFFIEHFSGAGMTRDFTTELEFQNEDGRKSELANVFYLDGQLSLLTVAYDKPNKVYHIYGYLLNEKGKIASDRKEIISVKVDKARRKGTFDIKLSRDKSKMLVLHSAPHKVSNGVWEWKVNMNVLNYDLQSIKTMTETFPLKEEKDYVDISNFIIDNSATVWMAVRQVGYSKAQKMDITKSMDVYQYDPTNGFEVQKIPIEITGKKASSVGMTTDPDGNLIGGGFYSERNPKGMIKYEGLKGSFFFSIDRQESQVQNLRVQPFGPEFAGQILRKEAAAKGKLVPNAFVPRQIIARTDGGVVMVAEYYTVTVAESRATRTITYYHGPIAVVSLSPEGEIEWVKAIPKNQYFIKTQPVIGFAGVGSGFSFGFSFWLDLSKDKTVYHSYLLAVEEDKLCFIYNDNPKNINLTHTRDTTPLRGWKGAVPISLEIDGSGNASKEILKEKDKSEVVLRPKINFQENHEAILIYGSKRGKDKFGEVSF